MPDNDSFFEALGKGEFDLLGDKPETGTGGDDVQKTINKAKEQSRGISNLPQPRVESNCDPIEELSQIKSYEWGPGLLDIIKDEKVSFSYRNGDPDKAIVAVQHSHGDQRSLALCRQNKALEYFVQNGMHQLSVCELMEAFAELPGNNSGEFIIENTPVCIDDWPAGLHKATQWAYGAFCERTRSIFQSREALNQLWNDELFFNDSMNVNYLNAGAICGGMLAQKKMRVGGHTGYLHPVQNDRAYPVRTSKVNEGVAEKFRQTVKSGEYGVVLMGYLHFATANIQEPHGKKFFEWNLSLMPHTLEETIQELSDTLVICIEPKHFEEVSRASKLLVQQ